MYAKYLENDIVIFEQTEDFSIANKKDCAVMVNGFDATFKNVTITENGITLVPLNINNSDNYQPTFYNKNQVENLPIKIVGIAREKKNKNKLILIKKYASTGIFKIEVLEDFMEFEEKIKNFITRIEETKKNIKTEEATKTSLIMPLFQLLGYDIFNPNEFTPEFVADVGIKKGEKVDYAIILDNEVVMLIEAKSINEKLEKHDSQLFRYFGTTKAKFAILTNGITYKFYTDLEKTNVMDTTPFLEINLEDIKDNEIQELKKFQKENFDINKIFSTAEDLKYLGLMKKVLKNEFDNPSDEFVKFILNGGVYDGVKTSTVIEKYRPILKKSINSYINELINNKFKTMMEVNEEETQEEEITNSNEIVTTAEEIQSYYIVKSILSEYCDSKRITYKDTYSYFGILFDNKVTKWICRVYLKDNVKFITISDKNKKEIRYDIKSVDDIYKYKDILVNQLSNFIKIKNTDEIEILE